MSILILDLVIGSDFLQSKISNGYLGWVSTELHESKIPVDVIPSFCGFWVFLGGSKCIRVLQIFGLWLSRGSHVGNMNSSILLKHPLRPMLNVTPASSYFLDVGLLGL